VEVDCLCSPGSKKKIALEVLQDVNEALQEVWSLQKDFEGKYILPTHVVMSKRNADYLIAKGCPSKRKRQRKKWAKQHGFRRMKMEEM
jgi:hypothetical protein